jgi:hypothetical protein
MSIVATTEMFRHHRDLFSRGSLKILSVMGTVFQKQKWYFNWSYQKGTTDPQTRHTDVQNAKHLHVFKRAQSRFFQGPPLYTVWRSPCCQLSIAIYSVYVELSFYLAREKDKSSCS